jgi:acyl-CoA thioesterase FadM
MTEEQMRLFKQQLEIGMGQADAAGVIFAPRLLELAHAVYEAFLAENGWSVKRILDEGWALPIVHMEADFLMPLRLGDPLLAVLEVEQLGESSFTLCCRFRKGDQTAALAKSVHVALEDGIKCRLPDEMRKLLSAQE